MENKRMTYLFGPVSSRRYGRSLGVDLSIPKICTFNCRFCQLGPTLCPTVTRTEEPPILSVLAELDAWVAQGGTADFITEAGSGEPTLHRRFGDVFRWAHEKAGCRSLLLSNGSLFPLPEVRRDAALADVVKVSLHAWDQTSFELICRPHPSLRLAEILEGYRRFRDDFTGRLDLEVFIVPGMNDAPEQAAKIAELARSFAPDIITLNTATRPPAEADVAPCPPEKLDALLPLFGPRAHAAGQEPSSISLPLTEEALIALVSRHPVSLGVLSRTFGREEPTMRALLDRLAREGRLRLFARNGALFAGPAKTEADQRPTSHG